MAITDYLVSPKGANKRRKRRGLGRGSGHGRTSCRGNKGQKARGKTKKSKGFEGGQMPLLRRLPKRGFTNIFRREYQVVNLDSLNKFSEADKVDPAALKAKGIIKNAELPTKILGGGSLKKKLEVHTNAFSKSAKEAIEKAGGKAVIIKK
jgi:large subunit ribosomal protein L15